MSDDRKTANLLYGAPAVAAYTGLTERQVRYLMEKGTLPSFKIDGKVCASRSVIDDWLAEKEAVARREAARQVAERERAKEARP